MKRDIEPPPGFLSDCDYALMSSMVHVYNRDANYNAYILRVWSQTELPCTLAF